MTGRSFTSRNYAILEPGPGARDASAHRAADLRSEDDGQAQIDRVSGRLRHRATLDDRTTRVLDFGPHLWGSTFGPLKDLALFRAGKVDLESETVVWPNGAVWRPRSGRRVSGGIRRPTSRLITVPC